MTENQSRLSESRPQGGINIEEFCKRLTEASTALILLSRKFELLETIYFDILCGNYPFRVCFLEVVHGMLERKGTISDHFEAMERGIEITNS